VIGHIFLNSVFNSFKEARLDRIILKNLNPVKINVKTITLDKYIEIQECKPDFVKIYVENTEPEVLK